MKVHRVHLCHCAVVIYCCPEFISSNSFKVYSFCVTTCFCAKLRSCCFRAVNLPRAIYVDVVYKVHPFSYKPQLGITTYVHLVLPK